MQTLQAFCCLYTDRFIASPLYPTPTESPPAGRLCSRIEALKKELRLGLGKELFAKACTVLEGGLGTENEGVGVTVGVSLMPWPISHGFFLLYHSVYTPECTLIVWGACCPSLAS